MNLKIAENIKRLRKEHSFTQEQLAEALGVTVGAVYKWENNLSMPEIKLLVEMAELFDTSVDVILGYGWEKGNMGTTVEKIREYRDNKNYEEGIRYAERALQKYPNSFEVVLQSANINFMSVPIFLEKSAGRAIELYERALGLIDQNPYKEIGELTIKNRIALCYCYMNKTDKAIELLIQNNIEGLNNAKIGLLMSQNETRAKESLKYLSDALGDAYSNIYNICIGYANAYSSLKEFEKIKDMMQWLYNINQGLREPDTVCFIDRGNIRILTILAEISFLEGDTDTTYNYLRQAKSIAARFDLSPEYKTGVGLKFYHGDPESLSFDDMGNTAMDIIENFINDSTIGKNLHPLWKEIKNEEN